MRRRGAVVLAAGVAATLALGGAAGRTPIPRRGNPLVWFAPLEFAPAGYYGSLDYFKLFPRRAPWQRAAKHVDIFKIYLYPLFRLPQPDVARLRPIVAGLKRRQIALAVEAGPLQETATCGQGVEGFGGGAEAAELIGRWIKQAGGTLRYVALDEPWYFGTVYDGPRACHFSADEVARQIGAFATGLRRVFPDVEIGDIEPLVQDDDPARIVSWLDDYRAATGSPFPFFHLDVDFSRPGWPQAARSIEDAARSRGIRFGFIYIGRGSTDREWTRTAENRLVTYEAKFDGRPDDVIFQSWLDRPNHVLPETTRGTFTWLINRYFRTRTTLALGPDRGRLVGLLSAARPVAGARVTLTAKPADGDGIFTRYVLTGTAPQSATSAVVGFRVNDECGCSGASEFRLYAVGYSEGSSRVNLVPNATFAGGMGGWSTWGEGSVALEPSDRAGSAWLLHVRAQPGQIADLNSTAFRITRGRHFRLTFDARVAPRSAGSGYFGLFFLRGQEVKRRMIALGPGTLSLRSYRTDRRGSFVATLSPTVTGQVRVEGWFGGDRRYFPSYAGLVWP